MQLLHNKTDENAVRIVQPLVNISETDKEVVLEAEMVGLTRDDISLELKDDELVITGRARDNEAPKGYTPVHRERCPLQYTRSFLLGENIDRGSIDARYENGILTVTLHKVEAARPRKIEIKS